MYWLFLFPHTPIFFFSFSTLLETHNSTKKLQIFPSLDSITKTSAKFPSSDSTEPSNYLLFIIPPLLASFSFRWSHASFCFFCHLLSVSCIFHLASVPAKVWKLCPPHLENLGASPCTLTLVSQVLTRLSVLLQGHSGAHLCFSPDNSLLSTSLSS